MNKMTSNKWSPYSLLSRLIKKGGVNVFGGAVVFVVLFIAISAPLLAPYDPSTMSWGEEYAPPSSKFLLGTDGLGRDVLSRLIWGARSSLMVGLLSTFIATLIGVVLGCYSGYFGGITDNLIMRTTDILMAFPSFFLILFISAIFRMRSLFGVIIMLGLLTWPQMARIARSKVLTVKEFTFVEAAKGLGASDLRIIFRHILPNSLGPIIVTATLMIATNTLTESGISFLGAGDPTVVSWGYMLALGRDALRRAWWVSTFPGLAIFFTVLGFNLVGDGLRDLIGMREG